LIGCQRQRHATDDEQNDDEMVSAPAAAAAAAREEAFDSNVKSVASRAIDQLQRGV